MANPQICFTRTGLQAAGALESASAGASTLTNPIHPIFRASNFARSGTNPGRGRRGLGALGVMPSLYTTITPALRLASNLINLPAGLQWWHQVLVAHVRHVSEGRREVLVDVPVNVERTREKLTEHAEHVSFRWRQEKDAFASTWREQNDASKTVIFLNTKMREFAEGEYHSSSSSHQLRFQFFLALNLCHELAHSVMLRRQMGREPFFSLTEPAAELGASWEHCVFGGKVQTINYSMSAADGLMWFPWQTPEAITEAIQRNKRRFVAIQTTWLEKLFDENAWTTVAPSGAGETEMTATGCRAVMPFTDDFYRQLA